jgi:predicted Zn-dependent protease
MKADPGEPRIRLNLGEALIEAGRPSDAIPHLEAARLARIDQATTAYDLTGAYHAIGRDDLARAALASIEITPGMDGDGLQELGRSALDLQDAALAERFLRVAVARTPALATADFYLAVALAAQGRYGEARQHAELALRAKPDLTDARDLLARLPAK